MPSSATEGKGKIKKIINDMIRFSGFKILDVGCGRGTYARLIEKPCYKVAVDAIDYREKFKLMEFYDEFHQFDIRDVNALRELGHFNLSIAGDVLEHLSFEDARKTLDTLEEISDVVIVAFPYTYEQKGRGGNHWEDHLQPDLTPEIVKERYPELVLISIHNRKAYPWNGGPFYGYYAWVKPPKEKIDGKTKD